jgi:mannosyltransferase
VALGAAAPVHTHWPKFGLLLIVAVGLACRLPALNETLWLDEAVTWKQTRGDLFSTLNATAIDTYPPLHNLVTLAFVKVFGASELVLRLPALLFGLSAIPATYQLGRLAAGTACGLIAAGFIALSPYAIFFSQEARMYALLMLATTLLASATIAWIRRPGGVRAAALILSAIATLYSHPFGLPSWLSVALAGFIVLCLQRVPRRTTLVYLGLHAIAALAFAPWAIFLISTAVRLSEVGFWIDRPDLRMLGKYLTQVMSGRRGLVLTVIGVSIAIASVLRLAPRIIRSFDRVRWDSAVILAALALGPAIFGYAVSQVTTPVLVARYLIGSLPALVVLAAMGMSRLGSSRASVVVSLVAIAAVMFPAALRYPAYRHGENWRGLAAYVETKLEPQDCLVVHDGSTFVALEYYGIAPPACFHLNLEEAAAEIRPEQRVVAVASHADGRTASIRAVLPGKWSDDVGFGRAVRLAIREPG